MLHDTAWSASFVVRFDRNIPVCRISQNWSQQVKALDAAWTALSDASEQEHELKETQSDI
jgi:hypothetical protein